MGNALRVIYLHGFASSPRSSKARFFSEKLQELGFTMEIPDLAAGDFEHLTISRQLALLEKLAEPEILIGSSMGGYLAALHAARRPGVGRLILLAPAFGFYQLWSKSMGPEKLQSWREKGSIAVFHYGEEREMPLSYNLMDDARRFETFPDVRQPCLVFHGTDDPVVPVEQSAEFAAGRPNVTLVKLKSGHELTDVINAVWRASNEFILASR